MYFAPMPRKHVVGHGECISSIAIRYGFFPDTIWHYSENAELRQQRQNPNVLLTGDVVMIPDKKQRTELCATGQVHQFRRRGVPAKFRIQFELAGEIRDNEPYQLELDGSIVVEEAMTDGEGRIEHFIPPNARKAIVRFPKTDEEYLFFLGHLEPVETDQGIKARLKNLGFIEGQLDDKQSDALGPALLAFQRAHGLGTSGEADEATKRKLVDIHGS